MLTPDDLLKMSEESYHQIPEGWMKMVEDKLAEAAKQQLTQTTITMLDNNIKASATTVDGIIQSLKERGFKAKRDSVAPYYLDVKWKKKRTGPRVINLGIIKIHLS